ncbi:Glycosyltransferase family 61 protein [Zea mays]|uniref:Glycosyltransferase family 61 protein n=1 Tax=Zea mays TaxID=4577 RepID=A0A1D6QU94_MAIZE|nr:Glycosyltransferase family 61 protein [Zea mays]
MTGRRPVWR